MWSLKRVISDWAVQDWAIRMISIIGKRDCLSSVSYEPAIKANRWQHKAFHTLLCDTEIHACWYPAELKSTLAPCLAQIKRLKNPLISRVVFFAHRENARKSQDQAGPLHCDKHQNSKFPRGTGYPEQTQWGKLPWLLPTMCKLGRGKKTKRACTETWFEWYFCVVAKYELKMAF